MAKHNQTIRRQLSTNCLSISDHFVGLALKGLIKGMSSIDICVDKACDSEHLNEQKFPK